MQSLHVHAYGSEKRRKDGCCQHEPPPLGSLIHAANFTPFYHTAEQSPESQMV